MTKLANQLIDYIEGLTLTQGVSDTIENVLLDADVWREILRLRK